MRIIFVAAAIASIAVCEPGIAQTSPAKSAAKSKFDDIQLYYSGHGTNLRDETSSSKPKPSASSTSTNKKKASSKKKH